MPCALSFINSGICVRAWNGHMCKICAWRCINKTDYVWLYVLWIIIILVIICALKIRFCVACSEKHKKHDLNE